MKMEYDFKPTCDYEELGSLAKDIQIEKLIGERDKLKEGYSELLEELVYADLNYELLERKYEEAFAEGEKLEDKYEDLKAEMEEEKRNRRILSNLNYCSPPCMGQEWQTTIPPVIT